MFRSVLFLLTRVLSSRPVAQHYFPRCNPYELLIFARPSATVSTSPLPHLKLLESELVGIVQRSTKSQLSQRDEKYAKELTDIERQFRLATRKQSDKDAASHALAVRLQKEESGAGCEGKDDEGKTDGAQCAADGAMGNVVDAGGTHSKESIFKALYEMVESARKMRWSFGVSGARDGGKSAGNRHDEDYGDCFNDKDEPFTRNIFASVDNRGRKK